MPRPQTMSASFLYTLLESIDDMVIVTEIDPLARTFHQPSDPSVFRPIWLESFAAKTR